MTQPTKPVGPWAKDKLESLRGYLNYYTTVLKKQSWIQNTWFVDAFAGAGRSTIRRVGDGDESLSLSLSDEFFEGQFDIDEVEYIKGSPRVALEIPHPFGRYIFIEKSVELARELTALQAEFPDRSIEVLPGDANDELRKFLARPINWRVNRGIVFIDAFGMQSLWTTVEAIAKTKALEVIVNFPLHMAIDRTLTKSGEIPQAWQDRLDAMLGSREWRSVVYENQTGLFGDDLTKRADASPRVLDWFRERLRTAFGHVSAAQLVRNTKGNPLYYLIWAGPHAKGLTGANYILGRKQKLRAL